jgi:Ulp1 family protease
MTCFYYIGIFIRHNSRKLFLVPRQRNNSDCGVFVCRYAYNLYLMSNQVFSLSGIENKFKELITEGPAFKFDKVDIVRIRKEIKELIDALTPLYRKTK